MLICCWVHLSKIIAALLLSFCWRTFYGSLLPVGSPNSFPPLTRPSLSLPPVPSKSPHILRPRSNVASSRKPFQTPLKFHLAPHRIYLLSVTEVLVIVHIILRSGLVHITLRSVLRCSLYLKSILQTRKLRHSKMN